MNVNLKQARKVVTVSGTAEALFASSTPIVNIVIKAESDNTGVIYIGDSTVDSTDGFILAANESISLGDLIKGSTIQHLQAEKIFIDAATSGDGVELLYLEKAY